LRCLSHIICLRPESRAVYIQSLLPIPDG
jgi:hypothetical protein